MSHDLCARPACPDKGVAWLAYDYEARCAWLDDEPADETDRAIRWPLCRRHADLLRVPRGWFSVDRRAGRPPLDGPGLVPDEDGKARGEVTGEGLTDSARGPASDGGLGGRRKSRPGTGPARPGPGQQGNLTAIL